MSYEVYTIIPGKYTRINNIKNVVNITWDDSFDNIYTSFNFETSEVLPVGTWVELYEKDDNKTVWIGIITKTSQTKKGLYTYYGYDVGFFADKNKITIQYKTNTKISEAIIRACKEVEIPCKNIPDINYQVKKIYKNKSVSEILFELLKIAQEKGLPQNLFYDCKQGYVRLSRYTQNDNLKGYIANIYSLKSIDTIHSFNITSSIEDMKNRIQVITSESEKENITKATKEYTTANNENIEKYGILQETIEPQKGDKNYKQLAENKLKELNKVLDKINLTVLGNYEMKKGVIIPIRKDYLNLNDKYLIKTSSHSIQGTQETVSINLEKYTT